MATPPPLDINDVLERLKHSAPHQPEFHQAVAEVLEHILEVVNSTPAYREAAVLERLVEPDRVVSFRVVWEDDGGDVRVNRGYRVQFNSALGPYKGGLRFHPSVNLSILKFLGFEQTFKNALTGLSLGAGKGGADFDPRGCSDAEIRRFCAGYMSELHRHIGPLTDVPAGDINVGEREIGFLYGAYRKIANQFDGALTGKGESFGGVPLRREATGFGLIYFLCHMLEAQNKGFDGQTVVISGAGNVATHAAEKAVALSARVVSLSDSAGSLHDRDGLTDEKIAWVRRHKSKPGARLADYTNAFGGEWREGRAPWDIPCTVALPCATQNELDGEAARALIENGCKIVAEGANMPATADAIARFHHAGVVFGPGKAANAGGVAVSGLEIAQNRSLVPRDRAAFEADLKSIMADIHERCAEKGRGEDGRINYARGANIAGFKRVAEGMLAQGLV